MFREFALKSGMRGFTYAETNNKFAKLMWYGIMLGCAAMTTHDVYGTVRYFMSFPTTTKVMLINNRSINLGSPTLSISHFNTFDNLNEFKSGSTKDINDLLDHVKHYFGDNNSSFLSEDLEMGMVQKAFSLIIAVVSSVTRAEHYLVDNDHPYDFGWGFARIEENQSGKGIYNEGTNQVESTYKWLLANNISIREAAFVSINFLCHLFQFTISDNENLQKKCEVIKPTWIGLLPGSFIGRYDELFSFQIPSNLFTFNSSFQQTFITANQPQMFSSHKPLQSGYVTLDFSGDPTLLENSVNLVYLNIGSGGWVEIAVAAHYKQINTLRSPCSANDYLSICQFKGRKQKIRDLCGCNPLDLNENLRVEKQCSVEILKNSANRNCSKRTAEYISAQIISNCHQKCDKPTLSFNQGRYKSNVNETSMEIYVVTYNYPVFEEIPLLEPKQILGSLGGNLSLYLGANFMLLYYTAFYWVTAVLERVQNRCAAKGNN